MKILLRKIAIVILLVSLVTIPNWIYGQFLRDKPNIILIQTDQQRFDTISKLGNDVIETPNIDRLVETGTTFTHAFATSPVCKPSRWSLHTGTYTTTHQTYTNHHEGIIPKTSLAYELKQSGYSTALIGKNHSFLDETDIDFRRGIPEYEHDFERQRMIRSPSPGDLEDNPMYKLTDKTKEYINKSRSESKPFFIWLSYLYPHDPFTAPDPYFSMYENADIPLPKVEPKGLEEAGKPFRQIFHQENNDRLLPYSKEDTRLLRQIYYGMISLIDHEVGRLLDYLDKNGLRENTIIVFTSDHGDYQGDHHMFTKSPSMYDVLIRVPLIFNWPDKIQENIISDELISQVDIMPTLLSLAEVTIPSQVQGKNISDLLEGERSQKESIRNVVYAEYGLPGPAFNKYRLNKMLPKYKENPVDWAEGVPWEANAISMAGRFRMARSLNWKYVQYQEGVGELYDMKNDPHELNNLYNESEYKEIQYYLKSKLKDWKKTLPGIEKDKEDLATPFFERYLGDHN